MARVYFICYANILRTADCGTGSAVRKYGSGFAALGMRSVDFRSQTTALTTDVEDLNTTKSDLETELVDLETQYDSKY